MYTIEQVRERVRQLHAEIAALPDPKDEAIPRKREELVEQRRQLTAESNAWHFATSDYANMERQCTPLIAYRDGLLAGRAKLETDLVTARAALDAAMEKGRGQFDYRAEQRVVDQIEYALSQMEKGFGSDGVPTALYDAVESVTHNFKWMHFSLSYTEHLISDWRERWLETLARLGDTDAARVLVLRRELWKIEEEIANEHESEAIRRLALDRRLIMDELIALGEFTRDDSAAEVSAIADIEAA